MVKIVLNYVFSLIIYTLIIGCADKTIEIERGFKKSNHQYNQKVELFYFFGEFGTSEEIEALKLCPHGVSGIRFNTTFVDSFISIVSLGVFTPKTITFYCKSSFDLEAE